MSDGVPIEVFTDFMLATGPSQATGKFDIVNECVKRGDEYLLGRFLAGKQPAEMFQGGTKIQDQAYMQEKRLARNYKPGAKFDWTNPQILNEWGAYWRHTMTYMSWTDHEIEQAVANMGSSARHQEYKRIKKGKEMNMETGMMGILEEGLFDQPDEDEMEGSAGETPYSIPCTITENTTGIPLLWSGGQVQEIAIANYPKWDNNRGVYDDIGTFGATDAHLITAFDSMARKVKFARLPRRPDLSEPRMDPSVYACSDWGMRLVEDAWRRNQQLFRNGLQEAGVMGPTHKGIGFTYVESLDTAELYDDGSNGLANEADADINGPRFYCLNLMYYLKAFNVRRYFYKKKPFSPSNDPYSYIMPVDLWHNNVCRSRQRQGIISPESDATAM